MTTPSNAEIVADNLIEAWYDAMEEIEHLPRKNKEGVETEIAKIASEILDTHYAKYGNGIDDVELEKIVFRKLMEKLK